jgi:hypothetical protein
MFDIVGLSRVVQSLTLSHFGEWSVKVAPCDSCAQYQSSCSRIIKLAESFLLKRYSSSDNMWSTTVTVTAATTKQQQECQVKSDPLNSDRSSQNYKDAEVTGESENAAVRQDETSSRSFSVLWA